MSGAAGRFGSGAALALLAGLAGSCSEARTAAAPQVSSQAAPQAASSGPTSPAIPPATSPAGDPQIRPPSPQILRLARPDTSDWDEIARRGVLRVLVARDRTHFFAAEGELRGLEYELFRELERTLRERAGDRPQLDVAFLPVSFDSLLTALEQGHGDVAAAGLTVTPEREARVAFTTPWLEGVAEVVVAHRGAPALASLDELAGRTVVVASGTSYVESLARLNAEFARRGMAPVRVESPGRGLATEDLLELVHSGAFPFTVADRHVAELWAGVLDGLVVRTDLALSQDRRIAWAVRRSNPALLRELDAFLSTRARGTATGNVLFQRYFASTRWIQDPAPDLRAGRLGPHLDLLQRLCAEHGFDWRLIAAQAYQESRWDQRAESRSGAVGLMQLMPATAEDMGVRDRTDPEQNLRGGIRYMAWLRDQYFSDPGLSETARVDLALAAYNAGPGRVRRWRAAARERGLDPDRWFGSLEHVAAEDVGFEPVHYVGNVNKYHVILVRLLEERERRASALESIQGRSDG